MTYFLKFRNLLRIVKAFLLHVEITVWKSITLNDAICNSENLFKKYPLKVFIQKISFLG